eukprot:c20471_g1_i2.p1 GENE.c20471_g1_i2~~c20471_g1_i2.p1  ORF type:complete len:185 (-),score=24.48 c20471_g1_i2:83-637(-)
MLGGALAHSRCRICLGFVRQVKAGASHVRNFVAAFQSTSIMAHRCWIPSVPAKVALMYGPALVFVTTNAIIFLLVRRIKSSFDYVRLNANEKDRFLAYIMVLVLSNIWSISAAFCQLGGLSNQVSFLTDLDMVFSPLQGFMHAVAYHLKFKTGKPTAPNSYTALPSVALPHTQYLLDSTGSQLA